ncbi:MAG TPA: site-specific DNA-methyltransferase [Pyrinomonadaceae bacterium]|nr:site-specific DNA-methyltransferase [Pyrinomonadaceae bacterium]
MPHDTPAPFFEDKAHGLWLYRGDALELLKKAKDSHFDLIFADPPYFLSNDGITCHAGRMVSVNKGVWDKAATFEEIHKFNLVWLEECRRLLKPNGSIWVTGTAHNIYSVGFAMQMLGFKILNDIAWYKVNPPPNLSCRYFTHATETILWARRNPKARHTFNYAEMKRENRDRQMQSLWQIKPPAPREKRYGKHPTQKPEALLDRIIRASTNPHDLVLDPFCGSGTTGTVCARTGRHFVGFELDKDFLEAAAKRIMDETVARERQDSLTFDPPVTVGGGGGYRWLTFSFMKTASGPSLRMRLSTVLSLSFGLITTPIITWTGKRYSLTSSATGTSFSF